MSSTQEQARTAALSLLHCIENGDWEEVVSDAERIVELVQPLADQKVMDHEEAMLSKGLNCFGHTLAAEAIAHLEKTRGSEWAAMARKVATPTDAH